VLIPERDTVLIEALHLTMPIGEVKKIIGKFLKESEIDCRKFDIGPLCSRLRCLLPTVFIARNKEFVP